MRLPIPSRDGKIKEVPIRPPESEALMAASDASEGRDFFEGAIEIAASATGLDRHFLTYEIPWRSVEAILIKAFRLVAVSTKLDGTYLCPMRHQNKLGVSTKGGITQDNRIDLMAMEPVIFDGEKFEDSYFVLRPFTGEQAEKFLIPYDDQTPKDREDQLKYVRVIKYENKTEDEKHVLKIKSITFRHHYASDIIEIWRSIKDGAELQRKLFYKCIAGMEFEYRGKFDIAPGDWQAALEKFRNFDRGLLNFKVPAYTHCIIEGTHRYGWPIFTPMLCEQITCRTEWLQAISYVNFFLHSLNQFGSQKILG